MWNHITHGLRKDISQALQWWLVRKHLSQGMPFSLCIVTITVTTDASMEGWGGHCRLPRLTMALYSSLWSKSECRLYISMLELKVVRLTRLHLEEEIFSQTVLIESDNTASVVHK